MNRMHPALNRNLYFVREHVGFFKAANNYDILDPETGEVILECREDRLGWITRMLRFTDYKRYTPFDVEIRTPEGEPLIQVQRGITILRSQVKVLDGNDEPLGSFRQRLFSIGGAFEVQSPGGETLCMLKGNWVGWNFRFLAGENELASVSKKWSGIGKELFTSADNYILKISEEVPPNNPVRQLILAAVMCIDMVLKEKG